MTTNPKEQPRESPEPAPAPDQLRINKDTLADLDRQPDVDAVRGGGMNNDTERVTCTCGACS